MPILVHYKPARSLFLFETRVKVKIFKPVFSEDSVFGSF